MKDIENYGFMQQLMGLSFVDEVWIFGSRARGDHMERSDIDIAIVCPHAEEKDWRQVRDIIDNADTLLKIDCVRFDQLSDNDKLKKNIAAYGKIIYKRAEDE